MTDDAEDRDLLFEEFGHAVAQAENGAALCIIQKLSDERGEYGLASGLEIHSSGPRHIQSNPEILTAGAAFRFALGEAFADIPLEKKLKLCPSSLALCAKLGLSDEDFAEAGGVLTAELMRASIKYFMIAAFFAREWKGLVDDYLPEFTAGDIVKLEGPNLRQAITMSAMPQQMAEIYPFVVGDKSSIRQMADDLTGGLHKQKQIQAHNEKRLAIK